MFQRLVLLWWVMYLNANMKVVVKDELLQLSDGKVTYYKVQDNNPEKLTYLREREMTNTELEISNARGSAANCNETYQEGPPHSGRRVVGKIAATDILEVNGMISPSRTRRNAGTDGQTTDVAD